jgi:site-specific recombinase XerD
MADDLRRYLLSLSSRNPGGVHAAYRAMRAFFRWYEDEVEIQNWRNPIAKVKAPRVNVESLDPVSLDDVRAMLIQCPRSLCGDRDRAILLCLLDTGCRAAEFVALDVGDVNLASGQVVVRAGKGGKSRTVFLGAKSRRELNRYLRRRRVKLGDSLWLSQDGTRLTYAGLREVVRRLARAADIPCPSLHSFRRAFAIGCLRNGVDLVSLQRLMGHADLTVLRRYLAQVADDLGVAHAKGSPVDNML